MIDIVISGGRVVTADRIFEADIAVDGEQIAAIGDAETFPDARERIDADGKLVMPGVVDPHVHLSGPNSMDTYATGSRAAARGGVTTVCTFAWQTREDTDWTSLQDGIEYQRKEGQRSIIDFNCHCVITEEAIDSEEIDAALENGVTSFKLFTAYDFGVSNGGLEHAFELVSDREAVVLVHTEDPTICSRLENRQRQNGETDPVTYPDARPIHAEAMAADDAVRLAKESGVQYYGVHTSGAESAEAIVAHRNDGSQIRAETCTHYTALDRSAYKEHGCLSIMAPPLREQSDQDALFAYLKDGSLDVVSTDHVAFTRATKDADAWWNSEFGINGLQRSLPVFHHEAVVRRGFSYPFLVEKMCTRPAETFGFESKGSLTPGTDADIVVFDPNKKHRITAENNESIADYTVYEGKEVTGKVDLTMVRGTIVVEDDEVLVEEGHGEYRERISPDWGVEGTGSG